MNRLVLILFWLFLSLVTTPAFALTGGTSANVKVTAEVVDENKLTLTPVTDMRIPTVYKSLAEQIYSNQVTVVPGGLDGLDALFSVTGPPETWYYITFNQTGALYDSSGHQLIIGYNYMMMDNLWTQAPAILWAVRDQVTL